MNMIDTFLVYCHMLMTCTDCQTREHGEVCCSMALQAEEQAELLRCIRGSVDILPVWLSWYQGDVCSLEMVFTTFVSPPYP